MIKVTASEAARRFSDLLNRVRYRGETFVVMRNGEPVCRIEPVEAPRHVSVRELLRLLQNGPQPDKGFAADVRGLQQKQPVLPKSPWDS